MKQLLVSLVVLAVCLSTTEAGDKYLSETKPCGPRVFGLVDSCCSMPKLLPFDVFKACFGGTPGAGEVEKVAFKAKINGKSRKTRETAGSSGQSGKSGKGRKSRKSYLKPGRRSFGPSNGPMCLIECVLRNQSLLNTNNEVDIDAVTQRFIQSAGEKWRTQVETQVKTCWTELNKVDFSKFPAPPADMVTCKPNAAMLMSCVRRGLILNCPASEVKQGKDCPANLEKLKSCDPFSIPPPRDKNEGSGEESEGERQGKGGKGGKGKGGKGKGGKGKGEKGKGEKGKGEKGKGEKDKSGKSQKKEE